MIAKKLDLLRIWCESIQKNTTSAKLAPLQYSYFRLEVNPPSESIALHVNRKRRRPLSDVDGGCSESKKKRRLRHSLITSRLSRPFSSPATYIYDRDQSRSAWARKSIGGSSLMRKAALVNHFRIRKLAARREAVERQMNSNSTVLLPYWSLYRPAPLSSNLFHGIEQEDADEEYDPYKDENEFDSFEEDSSDDLFGNETSILESWPESPLESPTRKPILSTTPMESFRNTR